ncbi:hypothetical protein [Synechococcus sp. HK01-R]|nr:hypothetical protein [Synechococcus sp. HK01-R]
MLLLVNASPGALPLVELFFGSMLDFDLYGYHDRWVLMELDG